ncbi:MAG TPA: arylsulfatase [Candidatus Hydrogenedentes bacterium]|nr:arylsulfatase [Candidatus Hydrogenedentota bacterium]HPG66878.1 arylsulfatase [Candidatus Hydrogenedentota bacterium]
MTRRSLLRFGLAAPALVAASRVSATTKTGGGMRPSILFIMGDQHRGDCIGADGHPAVRTPNLDRIAQEGVRFSSAYSAVPSCTPARSGLLTGLSPYHHGMLGYGRVGEHYDIEKPRMLGEAGYYTMGIGKMHWCPQRNTHGFHKVLLDESSREESPEFRSDYRCWFESEAPNLEYNATGIGWNSYLSKPYLFPERLHPTAWTGETAVRFLDTYEGSDPFFLKVSFARPHSPYDPPERFWKMYEDADIPKAAVGTWAARYAPRSGDDESIWHGDLGPEQVRRSRQGYYGNVSFIDEQIGRLIEVLEKRGRLEDTLIVYTADHGDMTGDHNLWRKTYAYEASARIPMLMRWPEGLVSAERGQVSDKPVELRDILPTFLDIAGAESPKPLDGDSLLKLARGKAEGWRAYIDFEHDVCYGPENHWNGLTDGHWKYIFHARDGEEQLFHLDSDPGELNDLAGVAAHADTLRLWRGRLIDHLSERGEPFVKNGQLALRPERMLYGPNYPGCTAPEYRASGKK